MLEFPDNTWSGELPDWVKAWIDAESQRPWPSNALEKESHADGN